jgi:hypothetical protein
MPCYAPSSLHSPPVCGVLHVSRMPDLDYRCMSLAPSCLCIAHMSDWSLPTLCGLPELLGGHQLQCNKCTIDTNFALSLNFPYYIYSNKPCAVSFALCHMPGVCLQSQDLDILRPLSYFGKPGPLLISENDILGQIIKFGQASDGWERVQKGHVPDCPHQW